MTRAIFGGGAIYMTALNFIVEYLLAVYFFRPLDPRPGRGWQAAGHLSLASLALLYFLSPEVAAKPSFARFADLVLREVIYFIPLYSFLRLSKTADRLRAAYLALYYLFFYETAYIYRHTVYYLTMCFPGMRDHHNVPAFACFMAVLAVEFLFALLVRRKVPLERIVTIRPFRILFVLALNLVSLYLKYAMMVQLGGSGGTLLWNNVLYPILTGLSMEFIMVLFESYQTSEEELRALQLQKELRTYELAEASKTAEANQNIRQIYHDIKNHLLAIRTMDQEGGKVSDYIDSMMAHMEVYEELLKTGLPYLDAYLSQKATALKQKHVQCRVSLSLEELSYIAPVDMISIIGNGVDNAGEALRKLPVSRRTLSVKSSSFANMLLLQIVNPFDGQIQWRNGRPVTGKLHPEEHGIGLRTIQKVAEKYGGSMDIQVDGDRKLFRLTVMLPIQTPEPDASP